MRAEATQGGYHHGDLKNTLLSAAEELLRSHGTGGLSLRAVARLAGVSHTAPYRHFNDKQALLQALTKRGGERLRQAMMVAASAVPHGPEQQLIAAGVAYVQWALDNTEIMRLMFVGAQADTDAGAMRVLQDIIQPGIRAGVFRPRDSHELALVVWSCIHGLGMLLIAGQRVTDPDAPEVLDQLVAGIANNVLYGIAR